MLAALLVPTVSEGVTLVSKSAGLDVPSKEEGNTEFEFGDVNGDGELDLVSVGDHGSPNFNSDQHGIMTWLGNGEGNWSVHQFGNFGYGGCALGDLNLDGLTDVAWGVHHNYGGGMASRLMGAALGDGSGAYWTDYGEGLASNGEDWGMFATAVADFDGDGLLDIASQSFGGSNGIRVYRNQGDGTWSQGYALTGGSVAYTLEAADVNADGYLDIVSTRSGTNILLGDGAFGFTDGDAGLPSTGIHGIAVGDINRDGLLDVCFGYSTAGVRCYTYDGASGRTLRPACQRAATMTWRSWVTSMAMAGSMSWPSIPRSAKSISVTVSGTGRPTPPGRCPRPAMRQRCAWTGTSTMMGGRIS